MSDAIIVSTFEGGYQPLTALSAATALLNAGIATDFLDVYVDGFDEARLGGVDVVGISVPLFDSLMAGLELARKVRDAKPSSKIVFFGQYATLNSQRLSGRHADYTVSGEWEVPLTQLVTELIAGNHGTGIAGVVDAEGARRTCAPPPVLTRKHFQVPDRRLAPSLAKYPQPQIDRILGGAQIVGGLETSRGCHHKCTYCSVFAAYDGKVLIVPEEVVVEDVANLVAQGMTHLTFTDADFFNSRRHGLSLIRTLNAEFPNLTYDFTTRVDHIASNRESLDEMAAKGLRFITSALEFPKQLVLNEVFKEVTIEMIDQAIKIMREIGIILNPTFIMFNPWIELEDMVLFSDFIERNEIGDIVDPIQYETRLHLYKGSPLLANPTIQALELLEHEFHYEWKHPDPRVDELYRASLTPAEEGVFKRCCLKC